MKLNPTRDNLNPSKPREALQLRIIPQNRAFLRNIGNVSGVFTKDRAFRLLEWTGKM